MRQLKHHEQRLLKKVDFLQWKTDNTIREVQVMRRYHVQDRADYHKYNKIVGLIKKLANKISLLDPADEYRLKITGQLLDKLFNLGCVPSRNALSITEKVSVSALCRRRLPVIMVRLKMAETVKQAVTMVEQGHIRVGPDTITDPAFLVNRNMEDYVSWVEGSAYKKKILRYNDKLDDYDLLQ
eukprot:Partr_v1_DN28939_c2_g1_i3_m25106 putative u3 small nucleolar ribonucleoprotein